jgi:hypothetical protein
MVELNDVSITKKENFFFLIFIVYLLIQSVEKDFKSNIYIIDKKNKHL